MITSAFLYLVYIFVLGITLPFRILPDASLPAALTSAITTANTYVSAVDFIFPVATFLIILGLIIAIEGFIILFKIMNWVIRKIPGVN